MLKLDKDHQKILEGYVAPQLLRNPALRSYNMVYLASLRFAQIPLRGTSDTLEPLYESSQKTPGEKITCFEFVDAN
jgi:hypothetical protein